jgi:hypothetical protein
VLATKRLQTKPSLAYRRITVFTYSCARSGHLLQNSPNENSLEKILPRVEKSGIYLGTSPLFSTSISTKICLYPLFSTSTMGRYFQRPDYFQLSYFRPIQFSPSNILFSWDAVLQQQAVTYTSVRSTVLTNTDIYVKTKLSSVTMPTVLQCCHVTIIKYEKVNGSLIPSSI